MTPKDYVFNEKNAEDRMLRIRAVTEKAVDDGCGYRIRYSRHDGWYRAEVTIYPAGVEA